MSATIDVTGKTFGRLTALDRVVVPGKTEVFWRCLCACGSVVSVRSYQLRTGRSASCGCLQRERTARANRKHGACSGGERSPEYGVWSHMRRRCLNPEDPDYPDYGGRGITVCSEWAESFAAFLCDMGPRPDATSIDRINNCKGYAPGNCRWATAVQQSRNRRSNRTVVVHGHQYLLIELAEEYGIPYNMLQRRVWRGMPIEKALSRVRFRCLPARIKGKYVGIDEGLK